MDLARVIVLAALGGCASSRAAVEIPGPGTEPVVAVRTGRLLDVRTGSLSEGAVLLVRRGVIVAVGRDVTIPAGAEVVDATGLTVLPGLIDAHVHLTLGPALAKAAKTLAAGFTTVADLGSANGSGPRLAGLIAQDSMPGPRVLAAGSWIGGRGGVCEFGGATIRGEAEARAHAKADILAGAELLKVCVTDWLDPAVQSPDSVELSDAELAAVAAVARQADAPLAAHAIGQAGVHAALRAGVRLLAHTPVVDSATARAVAGSSACVATTMTTLLRGGAAEALRASFARLRSAGARFVLGTDAGVMPHGSNAEELVTLVSLGMQPLEAIQAATHRAAECLRLERYGVLEVGSPADMVGVAGNPLADVSALKTPALVLQGGVVVMRAR